MENKRDIMEESVNALGLFEEYGKEDVVIEEMKYSDVITDAIKKVNGLAKSIETYSKFDDEYAKPKHIEFMKSVVKELDNMEKSIKKFSMRN